LDRHNKVVAYDHFSFNNCKKQWEGGAKKKYKGFGLGALNKDFFFVMHDIRGECFLRVANIAVKLCVLSVCLCFRTDGRTSRLSENEK